MYDLLEGKSDVYAFLKGFFVLFVMINYRFGQFI